VVCGALLPPLCCASLLLRCAALPRCCAAAAANGPPSAHRLLASYGCIRWCSATGWRNDAASYDGRAALRAAIAGLKITSPRALHNDFLWAKILLLHAENLFIDFGAES
jgi:hypothetical protein